MKNFPTLETERLLLRRLELEDAPLVYHYMTEREIAANTMLIPYPYPSGAAEDWISATQRSDDFSFAVTRKSDNLFLGACGIGSDLFHKRAEVGYWLGKPHWGQGYMSEAVRRVIQFGFEELDLNRIQATYFTYNQASRRVMEKAGMIYEGTLRNYVLKWGDFMDMGMCSILRSEWEQSKNLS